MTREGPTLMDDKPAVAGEALNLPNSLTVLRILLIPVFISFLVYEQYEYALVVLLVAGLTDGLDGTIARVANQRTRLGAYLDPLADKLLLTSGFITLATLHLVPLWVAILVVSRDLILMAGTLLAKLTESRVDISPTMLGKGTTLFQLIYLILVVVLTSQEMDLSLVQPILYIM
ncbi:MAG: CDP-alcohol phosphatidyltransferase family protein, partial [Nitrospirales bacterium]